VATILTWAANLRVEEGLLEGVGGVN